MNYTQRTNCPICISKRFNTLKNYKNNDLVKCDRCSLVFTKNIPSEQDLLDYYNNYEDDNYLSPITINRYNEILDRIEKKRKNNNILDVGCGHGFFLELAKNRGWNVYGTEISDEKIKLGRNNKIIMHAGSFKPENYEENFFDVITYFEVIEHLVSPKDEIDSIIKVLRPGGILYFTTPNFNSIMRYYLRTQYNIISYPEHLSYFTPKTLHYLLSSLELKRIEMNTSGISISRIKTSKGTSDQKLISEISDDEKLRVEIEKSKILKFGKSFLNEVLNMLNLGMNIKAFYEKPQR